ncbi:hypothetical protein FACS189425_01510 [Clostridia bacterium]|nr:hypothetical protein FACS189425_01510 [Clostridia bacterium]
MATMGLEIGGAETHVVELAIELKKRGWDVYVASNGGIYEQELVMAQIKHVYAPLHNKNPLNMWRAYRTLKKLIKMERIDIVHAHARIPAFLCGMLAERIDFKFITTAHWVFKAHFPLNKITNWGERTISVSNDIKQYLMDNYNVPARKIDVTINGIDTDKFSKNTDAKRTAEEFGLLADKKKIVYVSRMDTDRSAVAFMLIDALEKLNESNLQTLIVGGGNDLERLKKRVQEANEALGENAIIVAGARTDINKCVAVGDLFVGVSRAALEAMAAEKPTIIAGNEGYIGIISPETFDISYQTNFCCRGCEESSSELLMRDIKAILQADSEEMGRYNRELILKYYSVRAMTDICEEAYGKLGAKNVIISGYYGYKNMGDDCLLSAIISNLEKTNVPMDITVLSKTPEETQKDYGVLAINRFNIFKVIRAMNKGKKRGERLLISGGGSILQDVTSTKSIMYYLSIIKLAKMCGMKTFVYANGIGPVNLPKNRTRARKVLSKVNVITLREPRSLKELAEMKVECEKVQVTADPAFALEACDRLRVDEILRNEGLEGKKYFIISVRPWSENNENFEVALANVCEGINAKYGFVPCFVMMQPQRDRHITRDICGKISGGKILSNDYDAGDVLGIISRAEFVIGMRLHSIIYAAAQNVPFVGLSYDPKVDAIAKEMGALLHDVKELSAENILRDIRYIIENSEEIRGNLTLISAQMKKKTLVDGALAAEMLS